MRFHIMELKIFERFKAALIDMDGVLYDSMPRHSLAWKRMMEDLGANCTQDEFYLYEGMTGVATINMLFEREFGHGCDEQRARELYSIKSKYFKEQGEPVLMPGADRMLRALKAGGLKRVLVTGSAQKNLLDDIDKDYPGIFEAGMRITALDVKHGKPDPEPYLLGAEKAGFAPSECIVIENAPLGVRAGKAAGCFTIAVTTGPIPREKFEQEGADLIFSSMDDFADFLELRLSLHEVLHPLNPDKIFVLTDVNVKDKCKFDFSFCDSLKTVEPGESSKNIENIIGIWKWLSDEGATRSSVLLNVGGGVVSDLGGFAAATFKRGIRFVNVPSTLLAMADAAIGGKTGIDFNGLKNEIGAFAMPEAVVIIPRLLDSLPETEILSGFAEVVKMALLTDRHLYERLLNEDALTDKALMSVALRHAAKSKEEIVALDPKEKGMRRILNLGHTAGHAFETLAAQIGRPISHGEAVAHGILIALRRSNELLGFPQEEIKRYEERILNRYYKPLPFGDEMKDRIEDIMRHDKKNIRFGEINFVLLKDIAKPQF